MIEIGPFDYDKVDEQIMHLMEAAKEAASRINDRANSRNPEACIADAQAVLMCISQAAALREMLNEIEND